MLLTFLDSTKGRWSIDVWIASWILGLFLAGLAGELALLPYMHAVCWWAACVGVHRLLRAEGAE